ncbi:restriction endonuclease subunit S [Kocuria sp. U4B]
MFRDLPRYEAYQVASKSRLPRLPTTWRWSRFASIGQQVRETGCPDLPLLSVYLDRGVIPYAEGGRRVHAPSERLDAYQVVRPGDLVLNNQQAWRGSVGVSAHHGIISPAYVIWRNSSTITAQYGTHLFRAPVMVNQFVMASRGVGDIQRDLHYPSLRNLLVPVPPLEHQVAISKYLVHANARINKAIAAKRRLIALLDEQATVQRAAIFDGLRMERRLASVIWEGPTNGVSPESSERGDLQTFSISVIRDGVVDVRESDIKYVEREAVRDLGRYALRAGDVLLVRGNGNRKLVGRAALVPADMPDRIYPDLLMRIRFRAGVDRQFIVSALNSPAVRQQIEETSRTAVGTYKLNGADVRGLRVPVPDLGIQREVVRKMESINAEFTQISVKLLREISLLQEFRTRLVADVVTGQVDVRAIAATLADDAPRSFEHPIVELEDDLEEALVGSEA